MLHKTPKTAGLRAKLARVRDIKLTKKAGNMIKARFQQKNGQYCLNEIQIKRIINAADTPRNRLIIELLYFCALRREEVVNLQPGDIDFKRSRINIRGKGGKVRFVPMTMNVESNMKYFLSGNPKAYVFISNRRKNTPIRGEMINHLLKAAGKAAKIDNPNPRLKYINPHCLRHSAARRLKDKGVAIEVIKEFLGHESIKTTAEIYGLMSVDEIHEKVLRVMG